MLRENNGVTLVALVITIIVLLILAGVSISMVAGDNGILTQATNAADTNTLATVKSDLQLALASCQTEYFAQKYGTNTSATTDSVFTTTNIQTYMGGDYTVSGTLSSLSISSTSMGSFTASVTVTSTGAVTVNSVTATTSGS